MTANIDMRIQKIQTEYAHLAGDFVLPRVTDETPKIVLIFDDRTTFWSGVVD